ncbi:PAS domain-containing protein [Devosia sp. ZB163]|uniref:hybrid sensor histidine kinase/response regulator n=1 Tax=Devosia sp. ZB163 TaxID=3025938 RepID=UPI00235F6A3C|nr:PAS domain-containing protein [Devosia sp. ZB163]MDC9822756.1 PAS domain-containing protein [Devosia sp. ZB163]
MHPISALQSLDSLPREPVATEQDTGETAGPRQAETASLRRIASRIARLGGWRVDLHPTRLSWSAETAEIHEEPPDFSPDADKALSYYTAEHQPVIRKAFADCVERGRPFDEVLELVTAKGNRLWVRSIGEAVRDDAGAIVAVEGAFQNISHLVAMRHDADALSRRLRQTLESISDAFFLLDKDWRFSFLNGEAQMLLGRRHQDLEGRTIWDEFPQTVGSMFETSYRRAMADDRSVRFQEYFPPLAKWFDVDAHPTPEGLAVYFRDISRRKRAEEDVRVSNERFLLVAQATNDVIWDWDLVGDNLWWNDNLRTLFGHDPASIEPGPESWTTRIHPEDVGRVLDSIQTVIHGTERTWVSEYRFLHRDGHALSVVDRGFVIRDGNGKAIRMVGSMLDVSRQRELEDRLRQAQKLEAVGQLTGGVAHDFNNLLTVILGNAELLAEDQANRHQTRALAEMILTAAQRGADLTSRLLAFARKQPLQPQVVDLSTLIASMEALFHRTLGEHIEINIVRPTGLWMTEVDPTQLETAVLNLAINARDAMRECGRMTIELANATIDSNQAAIIGDMTPGDYVVLTVTDTGAGIAPEVLPHVFEPFFTTKEVGKGSGLGLSMVYGFVRQSGGHVRLNSTLGQGTSVRLCFQRSFEQPPSIPEGVRPRRVRGGSEVILVVEDDALVRHHVTGLLEDLGYSVLQAAAGHQALHMLVTNSAITLLFTDIVMPGGMSGEELAKQAIAIRPGLKVLFTSGYAENALVHEGRLDQGIHLLGKPYSRDELADMVRTVLD